VAASSLEQINPGNPKAIAALCDIIAKTRDKDTYREAAWSLKRIGKGNPSAIAALCNTIANRHLQKFNLYHARYFKGCKFVSGDV
jgi:hypothetical protein